MARSADPSSSELRLGVRALRREWLWAGIFSLSTNLLLLVPAIYSYQIYDRVLGSRNEWTLAMLSLIALGLYALMGAMEWVRGQLLIRGAMRFDNRLSDRVFDAVFQASLRRVGGDTSQALNDLASLRQFAAGRGALALFDAPWAVIFLAALFLMHPALGLLALFGTAVLVLLTWLTERVAAESIGQAATQANQASRLASACLANAEAVAAMGMLPAVRARWAEHQQEGLAAQQQASERVGRISAASRTVRLILQSLVLAASALLVLEGNLTPGAMIAASLLMGRALSPVEQLIASWKALVAARGAFERLEKLLALCPAPRAAMPLPAPAGRLSVEAVSAAAPGNPTPVLKGVAFSLEPGEALAVIGPSASGKSTLARLLVGVWPPSNGRVRLDGADVYGGQRTPLGTHIGYLPQDVALFAGTVAENIARLGTVEGPRVVQAAQRAGIHEMVLRLPMGYETQIGPGGSQLSGGQRQRIALARALYGTPALVVLDEPNSNLDEKGEAALADAVRALKAAGSTVVLITHRTSVVQAVDKILVLDAGRVRAFGPRDEMLARLAGKRPAEPVPAAAAAAAAHAAPAPSHTPAEEATCPA